jgi:hypothetical protein
MQVRYRLTAMAAATAIAAMGAAGFGMTPAMAVSGGNCIYDQQSNGLIYITAARMAR